MIGMDILQPVVALLAWTMVMWLWMYATRIPGDERRRDRCQEPRRRRGIEPARALAPKMSAGRRITTTICTKRRRCFYAVCIVLAIIGQGDGFNTILAWAYVGLRVAHSIVQATINRVIIPVRALCPVIAGADGADPARRVGGVLDQRARRRIIPPPALRVRQPHGRARRGSVRHQARPCSPSPLRSPPADRRDRSRRPPQNTPGNHGLGRARFGKQIAAVIHRQLALEQFGRGRVADGGQRPRRLR